MSEGKRKIVALRTHTWFALEITGEMWRWDMTRGGLGAEDGVPA